MEVPKDAKGRPRFSVTQFRTYGAGELVLDSHEEERGCPRQYHRKYVAKDIPAEVRSKPLLLGTVLHQALEVMESESIGPEEALMQVWPVALSEEDWHTAKEILLSYLDKGGPMTRYATLASELDFDSLLYVDEDFGPVMFRVIVDFVALDLDDQSVLHAVDYKSNAAPPSAEQVRKDGQMRAYDWALRQKWSELMPGSKTEPRIVMHLDALRYGDVEVRYTQQEADEWRDWAETICRKILRDEEAKPRLNNGCTWCPVQHDCKAWLGLPGMAEELRGQAKSLGMIRRGENPEELWRLRQDMAMVRKIADDAVKGADSRLAEETHANHGYLKFAGQEWQEEDAWVNRVDFERLQQVLGTRFWEAIGTSAAAIDRATRGLDPSTKALAKACITREVQGTTLKKKTVKE